MRCGVLKRPPKPAAQRAYELARSGECIDAAGVRTQLEGEGYVVDSPRLYSPEFSKALTRLCKEAREGDG